MLQAVKVTSQDAIALLFTLNNIIVHRNNLLHFGFPFLFIALSSTTRGATETFRVAQGRVDRGGTRYVHAMYMRLINYPAAARPSTGPSTRS